MILEAALLVPRLGTLDLRHLDLSIPGEFRQRLFPRRLPLDFRGDDNAALACRTADLLPGQAGLAFQVLAAIDARELEKRLHDLYPVLTQTRARITPNLCAESQTGPATAGEGGGPAA